MLRTARAAPRRTYRPEGKVQQRLWRVVRSDRFEWLIFTAIMLNVLVMATDHCQPSEYECVDDPAGWDLFWRTSNYIFSAVFIIEMLIKMGAYGINYFRDGWNLFDFFLVSASVVDIMLELASSSNPSFNPTILRGFGSHRSAHVNEDEQQEQGAHIEQGREGHDQSVQQVAKTLRRSDEPQEPPDPEDAQNAQDGWVEARV